MTRPICTTCGSALSVETAKVDAHHDIDIAGIGCPRSEDGPCHVCIEIKTLVDTLAVRALTIQLEDLYEQLRELKFRSNFHHDCLIHRLPEEVTSKIFLHCCLEDVASGTPMCPEGMTRTPLIIIRVIGSVCQTWRRIAWRTPALWNYFRLRLDHRSHSLYETLVSEWLARSGSRVPLDLAIISKGVDIDDGFASRLCDIINKTASVRVKSLTLQFPGPLLPLILQRIRFNLKDVSALSRIALNIWPSPSHDYRSPPTTIWTVAQLAPTEFSASHGLIPYLSKLRISLNRLTSVAGWRCGVDECIVILEKVPRLAQCRFQNFPPSNERFHSNWHNTFPVNFMPPPRHVTHTVLKKLHLENLEMFLDQADLPSLEEITYIYGSLSRLAAFITRSSCKLTTLTLAKSNLHHKGPLLSLTDLLFLTPTLLELRLEEDLVSEDLYEHLDQTKIEQAPFNMFLPNLRLLRLTRISVDFDFQMLARIFPSATRMSAGLLFRPLKSFHLQYLVAATEIDANSLEGLQGFVSEDCVIGVTDCDGRDLLHC